MDEVNDVVRQADSLINSTDELFSLSANENKMSLSAQKYLASSFSNRYYFESNETVYSDFPEFIAIGSPSFDGLLRDAKQAMKDMFNAEYVNLYPLSGIHAMLMVMLTLTEAGDSIASLSPQAHGHFATGNVIRRIGRKHFDLPYDSQGLKLSYLKEFVAFKKIKLIYLDIMSCQNELDVSAIRRTVGDELIVVYDASHTLGLIAGKALSNPLENGADIICGNTHKTFPGPHRGLILTKTQAIGDKITERGSNLYSTVQANSLLALIVTIHEMKVYGVQYATKVVENARILQSALLNNGVTLRDIGFTDNHQVHIIKENRAKAKELLTSLKKQNITSHLCYTKSEGFFVRIGTQEITRRGMDHSEMHKIASIIRKAEEGLDIKKDVYELNQKFKRINYSFDN